MGNIEAVDEIQITRHGTVDAVKVIGEFDLSNVDGLDDALQKVLSDDTRSCLLDLSEVTFIDSTVVHSLVRWSKEAQVSEHEALAIVVGGRDTPAARVLTLVGLITRLPVFETVDAATLALQTGQRPRSQRPLRWLTDLELAAEREQAQASSDAATRRLEDAIAEQDARRHDIDEPAPS
jgi:anti-anti-sigma factor